MVVARHQWDRTSVEGQRDLEVEATARYLEEINLYSLPSEAQSAAASLDALGAPPAEVWRHLVISADAYVAHFKGATEPGATYRSTLESRGELELYVTGPTGFTGPGSCVAAMHVSIIARKHEGATYLGSVSADVMRQSSAKAGAYLYVYRNALDALLRGQPEAERLLGIAQEALDEGDAMGGSETWRQIVANARALTEPCFHLGRHLIARDQARFNEALVQALEKHRDYWVSRDKSSNTSSLLAFGPLAFASLAHDRGLVVDVESEYIPAYLYKGEWGAPLERWS